MSKKIITLKYLLVTFLALSAISSFAASRLTDFITFAVSPDDSHIFSIHKTAHESMRELHVTDIKTGEIISKVSIPLVTTFSPFKPTLAVSPDGKKLYITDIDKKLYLYDLKNKFVERIKGKPRQDSGIELSSFMTFSADGKYLYIADGARQLHSPAVLHILDTDTNKIIETIDGGSGWSHGAGGFDQDSSHLYISSQSEYYRFHISVFDAQTRHLELSKITLESHIESMTVNPLDTQLYLTMSSEVLVADPVSGKKINTIYPADHDLHFFNSLVFALNGNKFYLMDSNPRRDKGAIWAFDTYGNTSHGLLENVRPEEIKVSANGEKIYVSSSIDNMIYVIDANSDTVISNLILN